MFSSMAGRKQAMREKIKILIDKSIKKSSQGKSIANDIDFGLWVDELRSEIKKETGILLNRAEYLYSRKKFWQVHEREDISND